MLPSSNLCREQEAIQKELAIITPLANVRIIAETAAKAWAHEALAADRREARQMRVQAARAYLLLHEKMSAAPS